MYYNVIRSSKQNLETLDLFLNTIEPGSMVRPYLNTYRRSRKSRRPQPHRILMYPGYAFVTPNTRDHLEAVKNRWTHHYIRSPLTQEPARVPVEQVEYAIRLEQKSILFGTPFNRGARVVFRVQELSGLTGTVQECKGHHAIVWPDKHTFPITCLLSDIELI